MMMAQGSNREEEGRREGRREDEALRALMKGIREVMDRERQEFKNGVSIVMSDSSR
jgi:hypothetical protein